MEIDGKGCVIGHRIAETVIRSDRRMTYQAVNDVLTGQEPVPEGYKEFRDMLLLMQELSGLLRERRKARGAIDFDFPNVRLYWMKRADPGHPSLRAEHGHPAD